MEKVDLKKPVGLYKPLLVPKKPWEMIHVDFVVNLLIDQNSATVLTMVDYFLKMRMFVPLSSTTAEHIARAFFQHVVAYYELLYHIIRE